MASSGRSVDLEKKWTAADYAYDALAASMDGCIIYNFKEDLDVWLEAHAPSKVSRLDGIGWIMMEHEADCVEEGYEKLHEDWEHLKKSGEPVNFHSVSELAKRNNILNGGWLFHAETGYKVDMMWCKVAHEFANGVLADIATKARVSPVDLSKNESTHVIVIKHANFTNEEEVFKLEKAIRLAGVKTKLLYKPDIYTLLGIYRNNEFRIRPTIYNSHYDILKKTSTITPTYDEVPGMT